MFRAQTGLMNGPGHKLFAGSTFACNQDRGIRWRYGPNQFIDLQHGRRGTNQVVLFNTLSLQHPDLMPQVSSQEGIFDQVG